MKIDWDELKRLHGVGTLDFHIAMYDAFPAILAERSAATLEGYALVPVEPTEAMIEAMLKVFIEDGYNLGRDGLELAFEAAIAAAKGE